MKKILIIFSIIVLLLVVAFLLFKKDFFSVQYKRLVPLQAIYEEEVFSGDTSYVSKQPLENVSPASEQELSDNKVNVIEKTIKIQGEYSDDGYVLKGTLTGDVDPLLVTTVAVVACSGLYEIPSDKPYTLKSFAFPTFEYNISHERNNLCYEGYTFQLYTKEGFLLEEIHYQVPEEVILKLLKNESLESLKMYVQRKNIVVKNDSSIETKFDMREACNQFVDQYGGDASIRDPSLEENYIFVPLTKLNGEGNMYAHVRGSTASPNDGFMGGYLSQVRKSGIHILEIFNTENGEKIFETSVYGPGDCRFPGGFRVYNLGNAKFLAYIRGGDEILPGYKATPKIRYYSEGNWELLTSYFVPIVQVLQHFTVGEVNVSKEYISLMEAGYPWRNEETLFPHQFIEMILHTQTLEIVDIVLHDPKK